MTSNLSPYSSASLNQKSFFILLNCFSSTYLQFLCLDLSIIVFPYPLLPIFLQFSALTANSFLTSPSLLESLTQLTKFPYNFSFTAGIAPYILVITNPCCRYHFTKSDFNNIFVAFIVPINFLFVVCFFFNFDSINQFMYSPASELEYVLFINMGGIIEKYSYKYSGTSISTSTNPQNELFKISCMRV